MLGIARSAQPRDHELAVCIKGSPGPHIASTCRRRLHVLQLGVSDASDFIALDPPRRHVMHMLIAVGAALVNSCYQAFCSVYEMVGGGGGGTDSTFSNNLVS